MTRFDQLLRDTIDEMTNEMKGPSADFANAAAARGRRIHRRNVFTAAGAALLVCAAIVAPWTIIARPEGTVPPTVSPTTVDHGWVVTSAGKLVLDRANGQYVEVQSSGMVLPAPVGDRVLINFPSGPLQLIDVRGTNPVNTDGHVRGFQWSAAGDRLVGQTYQKEPFRLGFVVIDGQTGAVSRHWIDHNLYDCSECSFSWTRDGREVVMAIADRSGGESAEKVGSLQLFDATTGEPTRSLPITGMPTSPFSWSPGGLHVIANTNMLGNEWRLFEVATGHNHLFPYDAVWVSDDRLLATDAGKLLTLNPDGTVIATTEVDLPGARDGITLGPP